MLAGSRRAGTVFVLFWTAWASVSAQDVRPAPKASSAVQQILDESAALAKTRQMEAALQSADRALQIAREQRDAVGEAQAQRFRARAAQDLGQVTEAIAAWQRAAAAWAAAGDGPGRVEALATEGLLVLTREPERSNALRADALSLARTESLRPLAAAQALMASGTLYREQGRLSQARDFYQAALELQERAAPDSTAVAESLNGLGDVSRRQGKLSEAEAFFRRASALQEKRDPHSLVMALTLTGLGTVATDRGDLATARDYLQRALALQEELEPGSSAAARTLNDLGIVARELGDLATARQDFQRALALDEHVSPDSLDVATTLTNLSNVAIIQGHSSEAQDLLRRALAIKEKRAPASLTLAATLTSLGIAARLQGDSAASLDYHRRALVIKEQLAPESLTVAGTLTNLGIVAQEQGDLAAAAGFYERALGIQRKIAPNLPDTASTLTNLGIVEYLRGNLDASRALQEQALAIREKAGPDSLAAALNLTNLGDVAYAKKDFPAAADYFHRALTIKEKLVPHAMTLAATLDSLSMTARQQGKLLEAERLATRAWSLVRDQAAAVTGDEARQGFDASTAFYAAHLLQYQVASQKPDQAFLTLEEGRAQALHQLLWERRLTASVTSASLLTEYQAAVTARDRAEQALSRASLAEVQAERKLNVVEKSRGAAPGVDLAPAQSALAEATKQRAEAESAYTTARVKADGLWSDMRKAAPRAFASPLTVADVQTTLPAGLLLVAFSVGDEQSHLFLLQAGRPISAYPIAATAEQLRGRVAKFRQQLTDPDSDVSEAVAASRSLFESLFPARARPDVTAARRLLISPDGPLWDVSFAALVVNSRGAPRYLGADAAITYTQSLTLFAQSRHDAPRLAPGSTISSVIVGNPIFDRQAVGTPAAASASAERVPRGELAYFFRDNQPPARLPGTQREAREIAALYGGVLLTGEDATEASLRKWIESADLIHLATHGYLHPARPMSSGVLLTIPDKEWKSGDTTGDTNNDGVLQAWEIYSQLKLRAELVVLSGCETGRGQNVRGEGVIGLTRALQYAGARSIIASQWKVDDESTRILMVALHRNLRRGLAKDEALRRAMATLRLNKRTSHPYDWAPFFLIGDPDNPGLGN